MNQGNNTKSYWEDRFREKGLIWGLEPSEGAVKAAEFLNGSTNKKRILDVGCGYGRDLAYFFSKDYEVTGVDFSEEAVNLGKELFPNIRFDVSNVIPLPYEDESFDAVYGYSSLHLLNQEGRQRFLQESRRVLADGGYVIQTVASTNDPDYGNGEETEENSFISKRGVIKHFYTLETLLKEFDKFKVLKTEEVKIHHTHDEPHDHFDYFVIAQKVASQR